MAAAAACDRMCRVTLRCVVRIHGSACCVQAPVAQIVMRMLRPLPVIPDPAAARGHITTFAPRHLATAVWALGMLDLHAGPLYDVAAPQLMERLADASDKALSMAAATYARPAVQERSHMALPLLRAVLLALRSRVARGSCIPDVIADTAWHAWRGCCAQGRRRIPSPCGRSSSLAAESTASMASTHSTGTLQREALEPRGVVRFDRLIAASGGESAAVEGARPTAAKLSSADLPAVRAALAAAVSSLGQCQPQVRRPLTSADVVARTNHTRLCVHVFGAYMSVAACLRAGCSPCQCPVDLRGRSILHLYAVQLQHLKAVIDMLRQAGVGPVRGGCCVA